MAGFRSGPNPREARPLPVGSSAPPPAAGAARFMALRQLERQDSHADNGGVDDVNVNGLRSELALLRAQEERLSSERGRLHDQIDLGFDKDTTRERERDVSDQRRQLHARIRTVEGQLRVLGAN